MSQHRNLHAAPAEAIGSGLRVVHQPARTDGVGMALRQIFDARHEAATCDFNRMLRELDRRSGC